MAYRYRYKIKDLINSIFKRKPKAEEPEPEYYPPEPEEEYRTEYYYRHTTHDDDEYSLELPRHPQLVSKQTPP